MLNKVILMGRITRDLELKHTPQGTAVLTFSIAAERSFVRQGEERQADFITCVAWRQTAEFISRYFGKGRMIAIVGNLRTRTYDDKNGTKHYVTEVYVDEASFTGEKSESAGKSADGAYNSGNASRDKSGNNDARQTCGGGAAESAAADAGRYYDSFFDDAGVPF